MNSLAVVSAYFNSEITGKSVPYAETLRGICFRPLHYFFEGRTLTWMPEYRYGGGSFDKEQEQVSYPASGNYDWQTTLKMAVLIVPGMIVGTIATIVAFAEWWFRDFIDDHMSGRHSCVLIPFMPYALSRDCELTFYTALDQANPVVFDFTPDDLKLPDGFDINKSHAVLRERYETLLDKWTSLDAWKDEAILQEVDKLMNDTYIEMVLLFKDAAKNATKDGKVDLKQMASLIETQHCGEKDFTGPDYCQAFMFHSIVGLYENATRYRVYEKNEAGKRKEIDVGVNYYEETYTKPFFTPGTIQYKWRRLFNAACDIFNDYPGLKEALEPMDTRYRKSLTHDRTP